MRPTSPRWTRAAVGLVAIGATAFPLTPAVSQQAPDPASTVGQLLAPAREMEPIVLTGANFADWAVPADVPVKLNSLEGAQCVGGVPGPDTPITTSGDPCTHNTYEDPDASTQDLLGLSGVATDRLLGYRWDGTAFTQIPFQVDEVFVRYLSNNNSGFGVYSESDQHTDYAYDREGFRWTDQAADNACLARPASPAAVDPVAGLDTDDELAFLARDAGTQAPAEATMPAGIEAVREVAIVDPVTGARSFAYVALAAEDGPRAAFDATNGYIDYQRDADADTFLFSESSYDNYGAAAEGAYFDPATGTCITDPSKFRQRRPGDQATITTPRYRFRYDGRWLMTGIQVNGDDDISSPLALPTGSETYGDDLVDQWKARAFQQRPGGQTPCCGFEEEVNNWGGSSILMGERVGPVRAIRATWGADSATNLIRREIFYRDEMRQQTFLRVHVIPVLDGIYTQWDYNATAIDTYYNPYTPEGVAVDGVNDEAFGNSRVHIGDDGFSYTGNDTLTLALEEALDGTPIALGNPGDGCSNDACIDNDVDTTDPTFSGVNALLNWEQLSGPTGTLVTRWQPLKVTPGGVGHAVIAAPYYRDDACFDDGTGSDPGPHLRGRGTDTGPNATYTDASGATQDRECWDIAKHNLDPTYAAQLGSRRFYQGATGTHGIHLLMVVDSDNAHTTQPVTEIDIEQRLVILPPTRENVGDTYGRAFERPLLAVARPVTFASQDEPDPKAATEVAIDAPASGQHTDTVDVAATLTSDGSPVADQTVTFTLGTVSASATTDANGVAATTLALSDPPGTYDLTVVFDGTEDLAASSAATTFEIVREATIATSTTDPAAKGDTVAVSATLVEDDSPAVAGRTVTFQVGTASATAVTDANGVAATTVEVPDHGKEQTVTVTFDGDDAYAGSTATSTVRWGKSSGKSNGKAGANGVSGTTMVAASIVTAGALPFGWLALAALAKRRRRNRD